MGRVTTILVEAEGFPDGVLVSASEFDPKKHVRFGATATEEQTKARAEDAERERQIADASRVAAERAAAKAAAKP